MYVVRVCVCGVCVCMYLCAYVCVPDEIKVMCLLFPFNCRFHFSHVHVVQSSDVLMLN